MPVAVKFLTKTSPSASTRNLTLSLTAMPNRLESATAEEGLMRKEESKTLEFVVSVSQTEKV